jgi:tRNA (cmo5U34)-methyltransferase
MPKVDTDIVAENANWTFENIADSFENHVAKSSPFYPEWHHLVCNLSSFFLPPGPCLIYDLGTSTGLLSRRLLSWNKSRQDLRLVGVDSVETMVAKATELGSDDPRATYVCQNIAELELEPCSLVVMFYTMQFIHPHVRQDVFNRIYKALKWGGALIMFEKVRAPDARFQDYMSQLYVDFKLEKGLTEDEIVHKTRSLKGVMEPFSTQGNIDLMKRAGFVDIMTVAKWVCFEGWLAVK